MPNELGNYNFIIPLLFNNGMMECNNVLDHKQLIDFGIKKLTGVASIFDPHQMQGATARVVPAERYLNDRKKRCRDRACLLSETVEGSPYYLADCLHILTI